MFGATVYPPVITHMQLGDLTTFNICSLQISKYIWYLKCTEKHLLERNCDVCLGLWYITYNSHAALHQKWNIPDSIAVIQYVEHLHAPYSLF